MTMHRFLTGGVEALGEREVGVVAATDQLARDGHILEPSGISLTNYRANPVVLWQHQSEQPIGACTAIGLEGRALAARIEFAPTGASTVADEICALVKSGVIRGISIGFDPIDVEPLDAKMGSRGGLRIRSSELLEISFCSVPVDTNARVVARGLKSVYRAEAILRALPRVSSTSVQRALDQVRHPHRRGERPIAMLTAWERSALEQRARTAHAMTVWGLQQVERERERILSYEQRQADLRVLARG
jgi:HK97 family phage prohead protease